MKHTMFLVFAAALLAASATLRADGVIVSPPPRRNSAGGNQVDGEAELARKRLSLASRYGAWAELRFVVRDDGGKPVSGATVLLHEGKPDDGVKAETDAEGRAAVRRICRQYAYFSISKDGFVKRDGNLAFTKVSDDGQRWLVDEELAEELRRMPERNPMLRRTIRMERLPAPDAMVGYDILKDCFTPPFGEGEVADFEIFLHYATVGRLAGEEGARSLRLCVKPGKDTRGFSRVDDNPDAVKVPFEAPEEYESKSIDYSETDSRDLIAQFRSGKAAGEIRDGTFLFEARGRSGLLKVENLTLGGLSDYNGFSLDFLVNETPGVKSLVAAEAPENGAARNAPAKTEASDGDILLSKNGDDGAIFFGVAGKGGFLPARYADNRLASMDGVKFLSVAESVTSIPAGAFEGAKDLMSVTLHQGVTEIGSRAFASCANLNLVVAYRLYEFEVEDDAFAGAGKNLTCVFAWFHDRKDSIRHGVPPWSRAVSIHEFKDGDHFIEGDFLFRREGGAAKLAKYLGRPAEVLHIPGMAAGLEVSGVDPGFFCWTLSAKSVVFPASLSLRRNCITIFEGYDGVRLPESVFMTGGVSGLGYGGEGMKVFVIGPMRGVGSRWSRLKEEVLPPGTRPEDVVGGALVETNGFVVLKRKDAACLLRYTGGDGDVADVPSEICGLPVTELESHLFAGRKFKKVVLPSTLRKIGFCAFAGLGECTEIIIPEGVEEIGAGAFFACHDLEKLSLPSTLKKIGYGAFEAMPRAPSLPKGAEVEGPAMPKRQSGKRITVRADDTTDR